MEENLLVGYSPCEISKYNLENLDTKLVSTKPAIITCELLVRQVCVGRIIEKGGETIRTLCDSSGARIVAREDQENSFYFYFNNQCESIICIVATFKKKIIPPGLSVWKDAVGAFQTDFPVDWMIGKWDNVNNLYYKNSSFEPIAYATWPHLSESREKEHVTITGTTEQVKAACSLILDKVNEEISFHQKEDRTVNSRTIGREPKATRINLMVGTTANVI